MNVPGCESAEPLVSYRTQTDRRSSHGGCWRKLNQTNYSKRAQPTARSACRVPSRARSFALHFGPYRVPHNARPLGELERPRSPARRRATRGLGAAAAHSCKRTVFGVRRGRHTSDGRIASRLPEASSWRPPTERRAPKNVRWHSVVPYCRRLVASRSGCSRRAFWDARRGGDRLGGLPVPGSWSVGRGRFAAVMRTRHLRSSVTVVVRRLRASSLRTRRPVAGSSSRRRWPRSVWRSTRCRQAPRGVQSRGPESRN